MKQISTLKTLVLVAGMLLMGVVPSLAAVKPSSGNVVISKVFYSGTIRLNGATPKNYMKHQYIELYNNSTDEIDIKGMYVALANSDSQANAWAASDMIADNEIKDAEGNKVGNMSGKAVVKQIFQISPDASYIMKPGQSVVIANCAIDHSEIAEGNVDLSTADFECKSTNTAYAEHNTDVPELVVVTTFGTSDYINLLTTGPTGIVLLQADTDLSLKTYPKGKTSGNQYTVVPMYKSVDCVDIVKQKTPSADDKRFTDSYDKGFIVTADPGTFSGQAVVRKTAFICPDGRKVLFDTNNSSDDFEVTTDLAIRTYSDNVAGLDETMSITIPESGYLAINPQKPFCGPKNVIFACANATNNAATTDLSYTHFDGNDRLLCAGPWIAIGQPGEYTINLSTSQGDLKTRSSFLTWCEDNEKTLTGSQASRYMYKFQNIKDQVGFKRVPKTDDGKYNHATFSDGDRLYIAFIEAVADKIANANGATNHADLDFIQWHGKTLADVSGIQDIKAGRATDKMVIYNLQGVRLNQLQRGLNIVNGKKVVIK